MRGYLKQSETCPLCGSVFGAHYKRVAFLTHIVTHWKDARVDGPKCFCGKAFSYWYCSNDSLLAHLRNVRNLHKHFAGHLLLKELANQ